jgi:FKBP-type peptidyl-prolyl cis-trans isomerase SlpA
MNDGQTIQSGSRVRFHYSITLEDGTIADSSFDEEPIDIQVGDGQLHTCLEMALIGLSKGEEQVIEIDPEQGFGFHDPDAIHQIARDDFPKELKPEVGQIISFSTPSGDEVPGSILEVTDETVTVDLNHPFAGHTLTFRTLVLDLD